MGIESEIAVARKKVVTDGYDMSVGELVGLFERNELRIDPEYQRLFRWEPTQKTRFIESLLLGIPTPPIFVATLPDGSWELVDGLQRVSTILEFFGTLPSNSGVKPPLQLDGTELLPSLAGAVWSGSNELPSKAKLELKRARVRMEILKSESDTDTKYELFQRLNTGGTKLEPQEVRNCVMVMLNSAFFSWFRQLSEFNDFLNTVSVSKTKAEAKYEMELVLRFLALRHFPYEKGRDVHDYLDEAARNLPDKIKNPSTEGAHFKETFRWLNEFHGSKAFKVNNKSPQFSLASYEVLSVGLSEYLEKNRTVTKDPDKLQLIVNAAGKKLWSSRDFARYSGMGVRGSDRMYHLSRRAAEFF